MTSKSKEGGRKSLSPWMTCDKCQSTVTLKDVAEHDTNCPPNLQKWNHDFILNGTLHSTLEAYKSQEQPKNIPERALDDTVFVSQSALQLCEIALADPVLVTTQESAVVKTAWPTIERTLTSVSLTQHAIELNGLRGPVKVQKLNCPVGVAKEFIISSVGRHSLAEASTVLNIVSKNRNEQKIFSKGDKLSLPFYGKLLIYKIANVVADKCTNKDLSEEFKELNVTADRGSGVKFYKALYNTKWTVLYDEQDKQKEHKKVNIKYKISKDTEA